jgi:hypothetical protein
LIPLIQTREIAPYRWVHADPEMIPPKSSSNLVFAFLEKTRPVSATETPTANQALAMIAALQESAEEIKFIRSPQEGEMGIEMLLLLAKEEAEEMPIRRF